MRRVNSKKLKEWLDAHGDYADVDLHKQSRVSLEWIKKVAAGRYKSVPKPITRLAICVATGLSEDELFPVAVTKGRAS